MWRNIARGVEKWGQDLSTPIKLEIESFWKEYVTKTWNETNASGKKYYVLSMFPYPSGNLHMGHVRVYSISDSVARFHRMNGRRVIHPMGWDAFGLPAENAAIERNISPADWTRDNIANMRHQLVHLGCNFDWDREVNTADPAYYKWTQALFLELFKADLVYKKEALVNWDPVDKTVLADEQVDFNGCSWRSGAKVERKLLNQWFVKTTLFAQQLYDGLDDPTLVNWKDIIQMQKHWIGECRGTNLELKLSYENPSHEKIKTLTVWSDKPETFLLSKYVVVPTSSILNDKNLISLEGDKFKRLSISARNPLTDQSLPVYVSDDVSFPEGCDALIGSPEVNEVDRSFFALIENLDVLPDVQLSADKAVRLRADVLEMMKSKKLGGHLVSSKLRDWLISRQRYWGTPIPIINCNSCGAQPVPEEQLPVSFPSTMDLKHWSSTNCPKCGKEAVRETDTMDTFVDSSWYYLRYLDAKNEKEPFSKQKVWEDMPVDVYVGGKEHATLHLYYARFMSHFLHSIGRTPVKEPFSTLLVQGMVMGKSFRVKSTGKYVLESEVKVIDQEKGVGATIKNNLPVEIAWEKMSKSKHNGVDPAVMFNDYSSDTTRMIMLADVSPVSHRHWSEETFPGILNWQNRLWLTVNDFIAIRSDDKFLNENKGVVATKEFQDNELKMMDSRTYFTALTTFHYHYTHQLSVAISKMQGLTTALRKTPKNYIPFSREYEQLIASQVIMMAPVAPHFASELWAGVTSAPNRVGNYDWVDWDKNVLEQKWPVVDPRSKLDLLCIVDGVNCDRTKLSPEELNNLKEETALQAVLAQKKVQKKTKSGIAMVFFQVYLNCRAIIVITTKSMVKKQQRDKEMAAAAAAAAATAQ